MTGALGYHHLLLTSLCEVDLMRKSAKGRIIVRLGACGICITARSKFSAVAKYIAWFMLGYFWMYGVVGGRRGVD